MTLLLAVAILLQQEDSIRKLIEQLGEDRIETREEAFRKLEALGRPALALLEKAANDPDGEVANRAKSLLVRIPIRERLTPALLDHVKGIHERLAQGEWKQVFLDLAADLRQPDDKRRFPGVRAEDLSFMAPLAVQRARTEADKIAVCEAVGRCKLKSALPEVVKLFQDEQVMVRANAAAAVRDAGSREELPALRTLVKDPHPVVRSVVVHAFGRLGARETVPDLVALLRDPSKDVRWWAVRALVDLDARETLASLTPLQDDADESVRRVATEAVAKFSGKR